MWNYGFREVLKRLESSDVFFTTHLVASRALDLLI
jgi:hypothetical protein